MSKFVEFQNSLESIEKLLLSIEKLEATVLSSEFVTLDDIITSIKPILRFIDERIQIYSWEAWNAKTERTFHSEKGICLIDEYDLNYTGEYPFRDNYWDYRGYQIWLTRSGKILEFNRTGTGSAWQRDSASWSAKIGAELTTKELLTHNKDHSNYDFDYFLNTIMEAIQKVSKAYENKRPILKKRIENLEQIKNALN